MERFIWDRKFYGNLISLTIPIFLQQLLRISVDTVNSIMLGSIDQLQMSAVSQANQIFFIFYTVCCGFSVGACVLFAQYWGKRDTAAIRAILASALRLTTAFALVVSVLVICFPSRFMRIYASNPEQVALGAGYLRIVAFMYVPCAVSVMLFAACRGVEKVKIILYTNMISYAVNIALDYCLLFGKLGFPSLGIQGIAIGTVAARLVEFAIIAFFVLKKDQRIQFRPKDFFLKDRQMSQDFIRVASPIVAHEIVWSLGTSAGSMITGQLGIMVVSGYNVTTVLYDLCGALGNGFLNACSVVIGISIGSGDREKVKKQARTMIVMGLGIGIFLGLVTLAAREPFLSMYNLEPESLAYAKQFMTVIACIWPFSLLEMVGMIAILRAGGDGKTGFYSDIVIMWMICIPLASLAAFVWHLPPVFVIAIVKMMIVLEAIVGIIRVMSWKWIRDLTRH